MHKWLATFVLGASMAAMAQPPPQVTNAQFNTEPAGAGPSAAVGKLQHAGGPAWLGYEVEGIPGSGSRFTDCSPDTQPPMDGDGCCGVYRLEGARPGLQSDGVPTAPAKLDVLVRIDHGNVDKIRFGYRCQLDAGGLPFTWLTGVTAQDSVTWLSSLLTADRPKLTDEALAAIALHETPQATAALATFATTSNPLGLREKAGFWLGAARGHEGLVALEKLISGPDAAFRSKLAFDLSVSHEAAAVDDLIAMARSDADPRVREQAIFWVAQKASAKASAALQDAAAHDPELAVKKKAVFALSQLPHDEAVSQLLHVAQTNTETAVRKEALFWLGQTHDPRALQYFESILAR